MSVLRLARRAFRRFRAAHDQLATEEFLIVQFFHGTFGLLDGLHLHESETFRALVMAIAHDLGVLHMADAVEQLEEIAFRRVEGTSTASGLRDGRVVSGAPLRPTAAGFLAALSFPKNAANRCQNVFFGAFACALCCWRARRSPLRRGPPRGRRAGLPEE